MDTATPGASPDDTSWQPAERRMVTFIRNVVTRYAALLVSAVVGIVMVPINLKYLGTADYGLWTLIGSITIYFSALDFGYGGAVVRFIAEYRAKRDATSLNEVLSTMFYVFAGIGVAAYVLAIVIAWQLPRLFNLDADQAAVGRIVLLITAVNVSVYFPFSVYGGVINGFERYYVNNVVGALATIAVAGVNVIVLMLGYGLVELVTATTITRILPFFFYRWNARKVFPPLSIRPALFRRDRLRALTGFSTYIAIIDWSSRLSYTTDIFIVGTFLNTTVVAIYAVGSKLAEQLVRLASQLHTFLFPIVVQRAVTGANAAQRDLLIKGSRFQLAIAIALCGSVMALAPTLIRAWVGAGFDGSILIAQLLAYVVILRAWMAVPSTVLKGSGHHRWLAQVSAITAVANLLLSIALVKWMGLTGVALGTVIPATVLALAVVFPRACRTVHLPVWRGYREVVWPAVWPALVVMTLMAAAQPLLPARLLAVVAGLAAGAAIYTATFFLFGLGRDERQWFTSALSTVWRRTQSSPAAA